MKIKLRSAAYDYDTNAAGDESALKCEDKSLTQQHMAEECDINVLVKRFVVTGEIPQVTMPPLTGDFENVPTYQEALNLMVAAQKSFMQQPAEVRAKFDNDPARFVDFCSDEKNRDELRKMGLWSPEAAARFELEAQTAADLAELNRKDAEAYRASKGDTGKSVTCTSYIK